MIFIASSIIAVCVLWLVMPRALVPVHIRWSAGLDAIDRAALETRFDLIDGVATTDTTFAYLLNDRSNANIRAIVQHPEVDDTEGLNRTRFRPFNAFARELRIVRLALVLGLVATIASLAWPVGAALGRQLVVIPERAVLLAVSIPPLLLVLFSLVLLVCLALGYDPLWNSADSAAPTGRSAPAPVESVSSTAANRSAASR